MAFGVGIYYLIPQFGLPPALTENFRIYCTTLMIGMPLTGFWAIHPDSIVKAHHDTFSTMVAGLLASFSNVALNTLFVLGFDMGIFGKVMVQPWSRRPFASRFPATRRKPAFPIRSNSLRSTYMETQS